MTKDELITFTDNLKPFEESFHVPPIPRNLTKEDYTNILVPAFITAGAIPKEELIDQAYYYGDYRNATIGKWLADKNQFEINRYKFGWRKDWCNHFEDDDNFALFTPLRAATLDEIANELTKE